MAYDIVTLAEQPSLIEAVNQIHRSAWPKFLLQDAISRRYWDRLLIEFGEYQLVLLEKDQVIGAAHGIPLKWVGALEDLPDGWDSAMEKGFRDKEEGLRSSALVGLSLVIHPDHQGKNLSRMLLSTMKDLAQRKEIGDVLVPVRPMMKNKYPKMPMGDYLSKLMRDGLPFDPWVRTHVKLGAKFLALAHQSMVVIGTVADWEEWTGKRFRKSGEYLVPGALAPVYIDRKKDEGIYFEPNIWVRYQLGG
jgi:GNAT superfamily N-acetyltransferase